MERRIGSDRVFAVAASAMAQDFNDELTVILSSASSAARELEPGHPARRSLGDLQSAAQRCARKCHLALAFGARHGVYAVASRFESVVDA